MAFIRAAKSIGTWELQSSPKLLRQINIIFLERVLHIEPIFWFVSRGFGKDCRLELSFLADKNYLGFLKLFWADKKFLSNLGQIGENWANSGINIHTMFKVPKRNKKIGTSMEELEGIT